VLQDLKWNTTFAGEVGLSGHSDEDVFAYAFRENRLLLTHDRDFLDDRRFPIHRNPGVIVFPGADGSGEPLVAALRSVIPVIGSYRKAFRRFKIHITRTEYGILPTWIDPMARFDECVYASEEAVESGNGIMTKTETTNWV
jgi:predicted nuclease of predicted toxin-antitoxin system